MQLKDFEADFETQFIPFAEEEKAADDGTFSGYASIYNNVDLGRDVVLPGAFKSALNTKRMPKMLWQHNPSEVIGVWEGLTDDSKGLKARGKIFKEIQRGAEALILMKNKAIDGLSIGYRAKKFDYVQKDNGMIREIKEAELVEISVVTFPMNPKAVVTDVKQLQTPREVETILRNAGVPAAFAKLVANHGFVEAKKRLDKDPRDEGAEGGELQGDFSSLLNEIQSLQRMMKNG